MIIASNSSRLNNTVPASADKYSTNPEASETQVVLLKKSQGSVWLEMGRTTLCPTISWLTERYGSGQYELRLRSGNRILCMTNATAV